MSPNDEKVRSSGGERESQPEEEGTSRREFPEPKGTAMKLLYLQFQFQYSDRIEKILNDHGVENYTLHPMIRGRDRDGRHDGSQVFPGNLNLVEATVTEDKVDALLSDLKEFRDAKETHRHLHAVVLPVERTLSDQSGENERDKKGDKKQGETSKISLKEKLGLK